MDHPSRPDVYSIVALFSRYWAASVALVLLVAAASVVQFALAPRHYTATQQLNVVLVAGTGTPDDALPVARGLVDPALLSTPRLASDILARIPADAELHEGMNAATLRGALFASHSGASVELSATWPSPAGAEAILDAATNALQTDGALLPSNSGADTVRVQAVAVASPATLSIAEEDADGQTLVQRLLMAVVAALLLPFALDALRANPPASVQRA